MRQLLIILLLSITNWGFSQSTSKESIANWVLMDSISLGKHSFWTIDAIGNHYSITEKKMHKLDSNGVELFTQSIKSFGREIELVMINSLKIAAFSKDQQTICLLDNTLTKTNDCLELVDFDIENATQISSSSRPNIIWIYDDVNSSLVQIDTRSRKKSLAINNINGLLGLKKVSNLLEINSNLYLIDEAKGVYIFDLFGTLEEKIELENVTEVFIIDQGILLKTNDGLIFRSTSTSEEHKIPLPNKEMKKMMVLQNYFFIESKEIVYKFRLEL